MGLLGAIFMELKENGKMFCLPLKPRRLFKGKEIASENENFSLFLCFKLKQIKDFAKLKQLVDGGG